MSNQSRRDILKGAVVTTAAAATLVALPTAANIPGLTPAQTLVKLAAEGKFASSSLMLPSDVLSVGFEFTLNGEKMPDGFIKEIYAPGDETGWAVVYNEVTDNSPFDGSTHIVRGDWRFRRVA